MTPSQQTISLGFSQQPFTPGVHICQIFSDDNEREEALLKFLLSGLQAGERTSCFSEKVTESIVSDFLEKYGISFQEVRESGAFTLAGTSEVYFQDGCFDPERMLSVLRQYYNDSVKEGYPAARVIGEMGPEVQHVSGGARLLEYESKVSILLRDHPVTAVCQYDACSFDGATIMDILKVHPLMLVRGVVIHNPFFIKPEEFLSQ
ncbi:MAG: hypothetical protein C0407_06185 [Desulfobacca sp.]|nr:hypothetical protein [Desulfobacca sp.]